MTDDNNNPGQPPSAPSAPAGTPTWHEVAETQPYTVVPEAPPAIRPDDAMPCLVIVSGQQMGQIFPMRLNEYRIGRADDADFCVRDASISRYHALLYRNDTGDACIRDLGSTNGTFVNGKRVQDVRLVVGDRIQLGKATIFKLDFQSTTGEEIGAQLYEAGTRDPTTEVFNRRYFDQHLEGDFRLAIRHREALSVVILELDRIKEVNDAHGQLAGDQILKAVATLIKGRLRKEDILARLGGEEFGIVLQRITTEGALALANAIRTMIEETRLAHVGTPVPMTVSIGVATLTHPPGFSEASDLLAAADRAMYTAKQEGRNRVVVAPTAPPT
ncbi:MAG: GGDEF domain-containing protein [Deltaproteobacteria bacterium]|nr:GGDEF domain-containing protein [Deltaproteobacteria bacterium]